MDRICVEAEQTQPLNLEQDFLNRVFTRVDQSIAMAALFTAYHLKVKAIASLTESGSTALWMCRLNCGVPIYALTSQTATRYRCALFRDVFPLMVKYVGHDREELLREAERALVREQGGQGRRPDRAHHRRADRQVRRHQHHEDRQGRGASQTMNQPLQTAPTSRRDSSTLKHLPWEKTALSPASSRKRCSSTSRPA